VRHHQAKEAGLNFSQLLTDAIDSALGNKLTTEAIKGKVVEVDTRLSTLEVERAQVNARIDEERTRLVERKEELMENAKRQDKAKALDTVRQEIYRMYADGLSDSELLAAYRAEGLDAKWFELTGEQLSVAIERMRMPPYLL
jgi:regulator of replication initiation timing